MASYGYGPPPPPPSASGGSYGHPSGPYPQQNSYSRGGAQQPGRGRGGHQGGRGDYRGSTTQHYEYGAQPPYQSQPPHYAAGQPPAAGYQQHSPVQHQPHAPQPLSAANYHPNYAPHAYTPGQHQQPPQPQHQGQPQSGYPAPQHYGPQYPGAAPPAGQWGTAPTQSYPPADRARGGGNDRGGKSHTGPPRHDRPAYGAYEQVPPAAGYGQPYPHDPRVSHYPAQPYMYSAPPPAPGPAPRHDSYYGQQQGGHHRGGRGGGRDHRGGKGRGGRGGNQHGGHQGGHHAGDKKHQHHKGNNKMIKSEDGKQENGHKQQQDAQGGGKKKKRKTNTLGLTPGPNAGNESESEDDEGEEKQLKALIGEGNEITDLAAFLAERKSRFPTKARIAEKQQAEQARSKAAADSALERQAEKLRKQLRRVESSIKRKREQGDEGDDMRESSPVDSSDDDKPEVLSTRSSATPAIPPPPAKKADISRHCKYYSTGGNCGKKGKCRFVHDPEVREAAMKEREANHGRLTIQQRLILNDKDQEDLTVLQSIQYLRERGFISAAAEPPATPKENNTVAKTAKSQPQSASTSTLPPPPSSLPLAPHKRAAADAKKSEEASAAAIKAKEAEEQPGWTVDTQGAGKADANDGVAESAETVPPQPTEGGEDDPHGHGWLLKPYGKSDDLP